MLAVQGYYDGAMIKPLEKIAAKPNQRVIITIMDEFVEPVKTLRKKGMRGALARYASPSLAEKEKGASALLLDAPQLFEARADRLCDVTVAVLSDRDLCLSRIMERDGLCHEAAAARLLAQKSDDFFKARCDAVLYNNGNKEELLEDVRQILSKVGIKLS